MRRSVVGLCIFVFLFPLALAVDSFELSIAGEPLRYAPSADHTFASVTVSFVPSSLESTIVNIEPIDPPGTGARRPVTACRETGCSAILRNLQVTDGSVVLRFSEVIPGQEELVSEVSSDTLIIDNQGPNFDELSLMHCDDCLVISPDASTVSFILRDDAGVDVASLEAFSGPQRIPLVVSEICEETREATEEAPAQEGSGEFYCEVTIPTAGLSSGNTRQIELRAKDLIGNLVAFPLTVRFDNEAPLLEADSLRVDPQATDLGAGGSAVFLVSVRDPEGAYMRLSSPVFAQHSDLTDDGFLQTSCSRDLENEGYFLCALEVDLPSAEEIRNLGLAFPYTGPVIVSVSDLAGNTAPEQTTTITIKPADADTQPDFWTLAATVSTPIDATTWLIHDKYVPVKLTLNRNFGAGGAQPISIKVTRCAHPGLAGAGGSDSNIKADDVVPGVITQLGLTIPPTGRAGSDPTSTVYTQPIECTFEITSRSGDIVFSNSETDSVLIPLRFNQLSNPQTQFEEEQERATQRIEKRNEDLQRWVRITSAFRQACTVPQTLLQVSKTLNGIAGSLGVLGPAGPGAAAGVDAASQSVNLGAGKILDRFALICDAVTCSEDKNLYNNIFGNVIPGNVALTDPDSSLSQVVGALGGADNAAQLIDPYKSEYLAYASFCIPAILYHKQVKLNIDCEYDVCLRDVGRTGRTVEECKNVRRYQDCRHSRASLLFAFPWTNMAQTITDTLREIVRNPIGSLLGGGLTALCDIGGSEVSQWELTKSLPFPASIGCNAARFAEQINDFRGFLQTMQNSVDTTSNIFSQQGDFCSSVGPGSFTPPTDIDRPFSRTECDTGYCTFNVGTRSYLVVNDEVYEVRYDRQLQLGITIPTEEEKEKKDTTDETLPNIDNEAMRALLEERIAGGKLLGPIECGSISGDSGECEEAKANYKRYYDELWSTLQNSPDFATFSRLQNDITAGRDLVADKEEDALAWEPVDFLSAVMDEYPENEAAQVRQELEKYERSASREIRKQLRKNCKAKDNCNPYEYLKNNLGDADAFPKYHEYLKELEQHVDHDITSQMLVDDAGNWADSFATKTMLDRDVAAEKENLKQREKELRRAVRNIENFAIATELSKPASATRVYVNTMLAYGRTGRFLFGAFGLPEDPGAVGEFAEGIVDYIDLEKQLVENTCRIRGAGDEYVAARDGPRGRPLARLSASAVQEGTQYQYAISLFTSLPDVSSEDAANIRLRLITNTGGEVPVLGNENGAPPFNFASEQRRVLENAVAVTFPQLFEQVCLIFPGELKDYFPEIEGAKSKSNRLCANIEVTP